MPLASALARLDELVAVGRACASGSAVVWDAGPVAGALPVLALVQSWEQVFDVLPAADRIAAAGDLDALRQLQCALAGARHVVVAAPHRGARNALTAALQGYALLGLGPDLVLVNQVPRASDHWPRAWARRRRERARRLSRVARRQGVERLRLPLLASESAVRRAIRHSARRWPAPGDRPRIDEVFDLGQDFVWSLDLGIAADARLRAGRMDSTLVLVRDETVRLVPLPSVMARCTLVGGQVADRRLELIGRPDPQRWRAAS